MSKPRSWKKVPIQTSMYIRVLRQRFNVPVADIAKELPDIPRRTLNHHSKLPLTGELPFDKRHNNKGRPTKLNDRDRRQLKSSIAKLRLFDTPSFTIKRLQYCAGLHGKCSTRTINRELKKMKYNWLDTRPKGVMTQKDFSIRRKWAKKCIRKYGKGTWINRISMFYDGVNFYHKTNPYADAIAPKKKAWRTRGEGLIVCRKGKKEGNGGKRVRLFVGISHGKGVVMCKRFKEENARFLGVNYEPFVKKHFPKVLRKCSNRRTACILQDGCPVMDSKSAKRAYKKVGVKIFSIPARSPDLNPIENIFHLGRLVFYLFIYLYIHMCMMRMWGGSRNSRW